MHGKGKSQVSNEQESCTIGHEEDVWLSTRRAWVCLNDIMIQAAVSFQNGVMSIIVG